MLELILHLGLVFAPVALHLAPALARLALDLGLAVVQSALHFELAFAGLNLRIGVAFVQMAVHLELPFAEFALHSGPAFARLWTLRRWYWMAVISRPSRKKRSMNAHPLGPGILLTKFSCGGTGRLACFRKR